MQSSRSMMHCCSFWITSSNCSTCCGTCSSVWTSMIVTERSDLLTLSLTSSCSMSNFSLLFCSSSFSSSNFSYIERFSHSALLRCSIIAPHACAKKWVACVVSSYARRRRASTVSSIWWILAGSSPVSGVPIVRGVVDTAQLDCRACCTSEI
jgi:hypothetical protein